MGYPGLTGEWSLFPVIFHIARRGQPVPKLKTTERVTFSDYCEKQRFFKLTAVVHSIDHNWKLDAYKGPKQESNKRLNLD